MHAFTALDSPRNDLRELPRLAWIAVGGGVFAMTDLLVATVFWGVRSGVPAIRIPQAIAGWVLGSDAAHAGGMATAVAGAALYVVVMAMIVAIFVRWHARSARVRAAGSAGGALYGIAMYGLLFHVLVPMLSAASGGGAAVASWEFTCVVTFACLGIGMAGFARFLAGR